MIIKNGVTWDGYTRITIYPFLIAPVSEFLPKHILKSSDWIEISEDMFGNYAISLNITRDLVKPEELAMLENGIRKTRQIYAEMSKKGNRNG